MSKIYLVLLLVISIFSAFYSSQVEQDLAYLRLNLSYVSHSAFEPQIMHDLNASWNGDSVFLTKTSLGESQLGNRLFEYFEGLSCSDIVGLHYVTRCGIESGLSERSAAFFSSFPQIRVHPHPTLFDNRHDLGYTWRLHCPYLTPWPQTHAGGWTQWPSLISEMIYNAIQTAYGDTSKLTLPSSSFSVVSSLNNHHHEKNKHREIVNGKLPFVPDAVILFRCVDIWRNGQHFPYGFVNFNVYEELIPQDVSHIYILTEPLTYLQESGKDFDAKVCESVGGFLVEHLRAKFPKTVIAIRRGNPVDSMVMMTHAKVVVSAPSTFSMFPCIANRHSVYMMPGGVFNDRPVIGKGFKWIAYPDKICPGETVRGDSMQLLAELKELLLG